MIFLELAHKFEISFKDPAILLLLLMFLITWFIMGNFDFSRKLGKFLCDDETKDSSLGWKPKWQTDSEEGGTPRNNLGKNKKNSRKTYKNRLLSPLKWKPFLAHSPKEKRWTQWKWTLVRFPKGNGKRTRLGMIYVTTNHSSFGTRYANQFRYQNMIAELALQQKKIKYFWGRTLEVR